MTGDVRPDLVAPRGPVCHRGLRRYWFPLDTGLGIGVTAGSRAEAEAMAEAARGRYHPESAVGPPVEDVDVSSLDAERVLPNMGPVVVRGVWFPRLNL